MEEVPYCFSRSTVKFQGHIALKIVEFDSNWAIPDCNSSFNSPMAMKCCTKLETAKKRFPIVFQDHPSNFKVTRDKKSPILTQIGRFRTIGRSQLSNPSDLPCCLVNSQISYGLLSWGFQCKRLEKLQKRIIRIITCSKYNAHTDPLFKCVNVLKINDVFKLNALKFYYKYTNNELPSYFGRFQLTRQGSGHPYDTQHGDQIRTTRTRINFVDHCLRNHLPSLINSTPPNIMSKITTHSLHGFSIYFKKVTISNYPQNCEIANCYICHRS